MSEYHLEIKQLVDYPRCRIYREFVQTLIADRSIRTNGGSGLFYYTVLSCYANFRTSYRRLGAINYMIFPGEWLLKMDELLAMFRVNSKKQVIAILSDLQDRHLIKVVLTDEFYTGIEAITAQYAYEQKAPTGTLTGVENNGYTNGAVTFKCKDEATVTVTKDGEVIEYRSGAELRQDGSYTITIENFDGYKTTYSFVIDREAPEVIFNGTQKGRSVGSDVALYFTDKAVIYKNGELVGEYVSDTPITEDGEYRVVVSDLAGNETEINFVIEKTAPTLTLNGVNVGGITKESITLSDVSEKADVKAFLNDEEIEYTLGDELSDVGKYKVIVTDACGNTTEYDFKIEQGANIGIIVLIVIAILAFGGVGVLFYIQRKNKI